MIQHVLPVNDLKEHTMSSTCECNPKVIIEESGDLTISHNSYDGREIIEEVNYILNSRNTMKQEKDYLNNVRPIKICPVTDQPCTTNGCGEKCFKKDSLG